jgi:hypothetical protein
MARKMHKGLRELHASLFGKYANMVVDGLMTSQEAIALMHAQWDPGTSRQDLQLTIFNEHSAHLPGDDTNPV